MSGFRNGDRVDDARVTASLRDTVTPGEAARPRQPPAHVVVRVGNPSDTPLLAALRVRGTRLPSLLADPHTVTVPRWTARRRFHAARYGTVGVVTERAAAELTAPAPAGARHCLVTVIIGQQGGRLRVHRLRVHRLRVPGDGPAAASGTSHRAQGPDRGAARDATG